MTDSYEQRLRVWSRLQLVGKQLCYCPTNKVLLAEEKALQQRLLELEDDSLLGTLADVLVDDCGGEAA